MREMRGTCFFSEWKPFSPSEGRFGEMGMGFLDFLGESQGWWTARERTMGGKGGVYLVVMECHSERGKSERPASRIRIALFQIARLGLPRIFYSYRHRKFGKSGITNWSNNYMSLRLPRP